MRSVAGDILTLSPPLIINAAQIEELFDRLTRALDKALDWVTRERLTPGVIFTAYCEAEHERGNHNHKRHRNIAGTACRVSLGTLRPAS